MLIRSEITPLRRDAEELLRSLGLGGTYQGFYYLASAAERVCLEPELLAQRKVTICLYPAIAKEFHVPVSAVERNIRTAVSILWEHGNEENLALFFGGKLRRKPTNRQWIDSLAYKLNQTAPKD